jgi:hypothetical protein
MKEDLNFSKDVESGVYKRLELIERVLFNRNAQDSSILCNGGISEKEAIELLIKEIKK